MKNITIPKTFTREINSGKYPKDALAIKFVPLKTETVVSDIELIISKFGNYVPTVHFVPVMMDGRMIRKATGHNWDNLIKKGIGVGATVELAINGDIIPAIVKVIDGVDSVGIELPEDAEFDGVHLKATGSEDLIKCRQFCAGVLNLGFHGFGESSISKLFYAIMEHGRESFPDVDIEFDFSEIFMEYVDVNFCIEAGMGIKSHDFIKLRDEHKKNGLNIKDIIYSLQYQGCGNTISEALGKHLSGIPQDFFGLTKDIVTSAVIEGQEINLGIRRAFDLLGMNGVAVNLIKEEAVNESSGEPVNYILTGSPKDAGYKTKADFKLVLPSNYVEVKKMKDANILYTNEPDSTTKKMSEADKFGVEIRTYENI